jgi:hypothetical protein
LPKASEGGASHATRLLVLEPDSESYQG